MNTKQIAQRIYTGIPTIEKQAVGYKVIANESTFHASEETFFCNSFKEPNTKHEIGDLQRISHTALYSIPRNEIPRAVVLLGGNRAAIWAA